MIKKPLRACLLVLFALAIILVLAENVFADITDYEVVIVNNCYHMTAKSNHKNADIQVYIWKNGEINITDKIDKTRGGGGKTDANGNIDVWMKQGVISAGQVIVIKVDNQQAMAMATEPSVGGYSIAVQTDKTNSLFPYIGATAAILAAAIAAPIYAKRLMRRKHGD